MALRNLILVQFPGVRAGGRYDDATLDIVGIGAVNTSDKGVYIEVEHRATGRKRSVTIAAGESAFRDVRDLNLKMVDAETPPFDIRARYPA